MNLKTNLLEHQKDAFEKMKTVPVGALFMEMGTGKTRTTLELIKYRINSGKIKKIVWFTPISVKRNLEREIRKHCDIDIYIFDDKTNELSNINSTLMIIGTESVVSDRVKLAIDKVVNNSVMVIVDESTYIKNRRGKGSRYIDSLSAKCKYKLILSGTPITNSISDLYYQFNFLSPKILGYRSFTSFAKTHLEYDKNIPERVIGGKDIDFIMDRISNYTFSIRKEECVKLPKKKYVMLDIEMSQEQKKLYKEVKNELLFENYAEYKETDILLLFIKLQQVSSGFLSQEDKTDIIGTTKLNATIKLLDEIKSKVVIFYNFRVEEHFLKKIDKKIKIIHGSISPVKRDKIIKNFETDENEILAINLSCGSYGLNLQFIKNVIYFSNKFNFAERTQSEDRFHRIGQVYDVTYYDFVSSNIEKRIYESLALKESLLNYVSDKLKEKNNDYKEFL